MIDNRILRPGNVTDGMGRRSRKIKVIGEFSELRRRQIKMERPWNGNPDADLVVDAGRRQTENSRGRSGLRALTGAGSNDDTLIVANDGEDQLKALRNNHRRFADAVTAQLRGNCRPAKSSG